MVTFRLYAAAREAAGCDELAVEAGPLDLMLAELADRLPTRFSQVLALSSLVSDGVRRSRDDAAPVQPGTVIEVLPPFAGG